MTYIKTANGYVKSNITVSAEYERSLLEPIDYSDPKVRENFANLKSGWKKGELERAMSRKPSDPTCELSYLDERMQPSFHTYLEEMWDEEFYRDQDGVVRPKARPLPKEPRHHRSRPLRPYIGCPDCPRWDNQKGCIKQFEDTTLCQEIEDRYKEKGE